MIAQLEWTRTGSPTGFFIARFDSDGQWWVLHAAGTSRLETLATLKARNQGTLDTSQAFIAAVPGQVDYLFSDQTADVNGASHYQVIQWFKLLAQLSAHRTLAPSSDTATWTSSTPLDHLVLMRRRYLKDWAVRQLTITDSVGAVRGQIAYQSTLTGKDYAVAVPARTRAIEIAGSSRLRVEGSLLIHDVAQNVMEWK